MRHGIKYINIEQTIAVTLAITIFILNMAYIYKDAYTYIKKRRLLLSNNV